jgi:predicted O-methyltransferase YrrM
MQSDPCAAQPRARFHSAEGAVVNSPEGGTRQHLMLDRTRPGGLIVADNVVRGGALADVESDEPSIPAQRRFHEMIAADPRVTATTIQTVGSKGYDGFTLALVTA